jgi:hypothetical protein
VQHISPGQSQAPPAPRPACPSWGATTLPHGLSIVRETGGATCTDCPGKLPNPPGLSIGATLPSHHAPAAHRGQSPPLLPPRYSTPSYNAPQRGREGIEGVIPISWVLSLVWLDLQGRRTYRALTDFRRLHEAKEYRRQR